MDTPIGKLKNKTTVHCTICNSSYKRTSNINIYSKDSCEIQKAKSKLTQKANATYTCRICKTIKSEIN